MSKPRNRPSDRARLRAALAVMKQQGADLLALRETLDRVRAERDAREERPTDVDRAHLFASGLPGLPFGRPVAGHTLVGEHRPYSWRDWARELMTQRDYAIADRRRYAEALTQVNGVRAVLRLSRSDSLMTFLANSLALAVAGAGAGEIPLYPDSPAEMVTQMRRIRTAMNHPDQLAQLVRT